MSTRTDLASSGGPGPASSRRLSLNRALVIGVALALWTAILAALRLLAV